jgi:hypothetical protein
MKPTAAIARFPFRDHRNMAQVLAAEGVDNGAQVCVMRADLLGKKTAREVVEHLAGPDQRTHGGAPWL